MAVWVYKVKDDGSPVKSLIEPHRLQAALHAGWSVDKPTAKKVSKKKASAKLPESAPVQGELVQSAKVDSADAKPT